VSDGLPALTARRVALQAEIARRRGEVVATYGDVERGVAPVDRAIVTVRRLAPLIAVAGVVALIVVGPGKTLRVLSRGLTLAVTAGQAVRLLR
jgi:hypothetical protein